MSSTKNKSSGLAPERIIDRYRVDKILGRGGMAIVYQVQDTISQKKLALKKMIEPQKGKNQENLAELFEHEYHILSQLAHPRVIEVYDYGIDQTSPFYTMELLDGGDLRELSPVPWKKACSFLRDVCSALSLLHSRRQIHRDLTPRNIRCTRDGKAKLIDFGAMVPMGHCRHIVGTPPFTSPEVINGLALDVRTDLYSLGATAYFALTGSHAYPARNFRELRDMWLTPPLPLSDIVQEIPDELDDLVMSLLSIDNLGRPSNAAEVFERLNAIASLETEEQLLVSKAYLSTPTLVGREEPLTRVRKKILDSSKNLGGTIVIKGASGVGRTRFLDACLLESKLSGAIVLRADASDKSAGNWGIVRTLISQLLGNLPELSLRTVKPYISILGHVFPGLLYTFEASLQGSIENTSEGVWKRISSFPPPLLDTSFGTSSTENEGSVESAEPTEAIASENGSFRDEQLDEEDSAASDLTVQQEHKSSTWTEVWGRGSSLRPPAPERSHSIVLETIEHARLLRPKVQSALRDWLIEICRHRFIAIAVDDVHHIDEPSAACLALLSSEIFNKKMVITVSIESDAVSDTGSAIKLLMDKCVSVNITNLDLNNTNQLLGSVFGDVPHLHILATKLHALSRGNPRAVMQLAQHLIDQEIVRFQSGSWFLPADLDARYMPHSLSETLKLRIEKLPPTARQLAQALSLSPDQNFSFDECQILSYTNEPSLLLRDIDELISSDILSTDGQTYSFSQQGWIQVLTQGIDPEQQCIYHLKLAEIFKNKRSPDIMRAAKHFLLAGNRDLGLEALLEDIKQARWMILNNENTYSEAIASLPSDWIEMHEYALEICRQLNKPIRQSYMIRFALVGISAAKNCVNTQHLIKVLDQLYHDSGLDIYKKLGNTLDPPTRVARALELAQQRYDSMEEPNRNLSPAEAIRDLAQVFVITIGAAGTSLDCTLLAYLPSLEPYLPLSPALEIIILDCQSTYDVITARMDKALDGFLQLLDRIEQPDRGGLDETVHTYVRFSVMYAAGTIESSMGIKSSLKWANQIEQHSLFQVSAWRIRMVHYLVQGDITRANNCKKRMEYLQMQNAPTQIFEGSNLFTELLAYSRMDDLTGIRQVIPAIQKVAKRIEVWIPILRFAEGNYHRIRGDYLSAQGKLEESLRSVKPGNHIIWPYTAFSYLLTLFGMNLYKDVIELAQAFLEQSQQLDLGFASIFLRLPLSLSYAKSGDQAMATHQSETAIDSFEKLGSTGLTTGLAYETRARVAIYNGEQEKFRTYAKLCAQQYQVGDNPTLTAKFEKLMRDARQAEITVSNSMDRVSALISKQQAASTQISTILTQYSRGKDKMRRILEILIEQSHTKGGFLYIMNQNGPVLSARSYKQPPSMEIETVAKEFLAGEIENMKEVTATSPDLEASQETRVDWVMYNDDKFIPLLIGHTTKLGYAIVGLAVLQIDTDELFKYPVDTITALSESLLISGDVVPIYSKVK